MYTKSILLSFVAILLLGSCTDSQLTPSSWLHELSKDKVLVNSNINDYSQTRAAVTSTLYDLKSNGFNLLALDATGDSVWLAKNTWSGTAFGADNATWTKAGEMSFYASYPESFKFNSSSKKLYYTGSNQQRPYQGVDPLVGFTKTAKKNVVSIDFYHVLSQIRAKVVNNSELGICVHADLKSYFVDGAFTWNEPVDYVTSSGVSSKKLPAQCWNVGDMKTCNGFIGTSVGSTIGTLATPMSKGETGTMLTENIVPIIFPGGLRKTVSGEVETDATSIVFTMYYDNDGISNTVIFEKKIEELMPGVAYDVILEVTGDENPEAVMSVAAVDDFISIQRLTAFDLIKDTNCNVNVSVNDMNMGSVSKKVSGETVTVEAIAKSTFKFVQWSDGSTTAKRTFNISDNVSLVAEFGEDWIYSSLYIWWADSQYSKMTKTDETHVFTGTLDVTAAPMTVWISNKTKTTQSNRIIWGSTAENQSMSPLGNMVQDGYGYIFEEAGKYDITFNEKTLAYTARKQVSDFYELIAQLSALIASCESDDPNDYDYTAESLNAYNAALANAKSALTSTDANVVQTAYDNLLAAFNGLTTGSTTAIIPDISL